MLEGLILLGSNGLLCTGPACRGVWLATASCPDSPQVLAACLRHAYGGRLRWNSPQQRAFWIALLHPGTIHEIRGPLRMYCAGLPFKGGRFRCSLELVQGHRKRSGRASCHCIQVFTTGHRRTRDEHSR